MFGIAHSIPEGPFGENKSFMEDIVGWAKQTDRLYLWDYVTQFTHYPHEITPVDWTGAFVHGLRGAARKRASNRPNQVRCKQTSANLI